MLRHIFKDFNENESNSMRIGPASVGMVGNCLHCEDRAEIFDVKTFLVNRCHGIRLKTEVIFIVLQDLRTSIRMGVVIQTVT